MKYANVWACVSLFLLVCILANPTQSLAAATHFSVTAPASATAGISFSVTVTALDSNNQVVTSYSGTVHFSSTDRMAVLPANSQLTSGVGTFKITLKTAGTQTVTATDASASTVTGHASIAVKAAAATHYSLGAPSNITVGITFGLTVKARDAFNNVATTYTGTVHFTSSDSQAVLPANSTLVAGVKTFNVALKSKGTQTIAATDTVTSTITGSISRSVVYRMVGFREDTGNQFAAQFNADVPGSAAMNVVTSATAALAPASFGVSVPELGTNGPVAYQIPSSTPTLGGSQFGLYTSGAKRVIIGSAQGHFYKYLGFTSTGRLVYWDSTGSTSFDIHSTDLKGGNNQVLLAGCTAQPVVRVNAKGVLISCPIGTDAAVWASDGTASAVNLPGTTSNMLLLDYFPEGAILISGSIVYYEPVDGTATGPIVLSPEVNDSADTYYGGITDASFHDVLIASHTTDTVPFHLWSMGVDGTFTWFFPKKCGTTPSISPGFDGVHFMAVCPNAAGSGHNYVYRLSLTDGNDVLQLTPPNTNDSEAHLLPDGGMIVRAAGGGWRYVPANASGLPASPQTTITTVGPTSGFLGVLGNWMLFNDQSGVANLTSVNEDMVHVAFLSNKLANNPRAAFSPTHIAFIDTSGGVHVAAPDGSLLTTLDANPSNNIQFSGVEPGGREFWIVTHATGEKDTLALDPVAGVQIVLGGATSDSGWLVP
ncbi:MAG TPA: hypothetical protein VFI95_25310 [Terriglobales bacterium]|nr:hypothetical protein [Terriglobales bacterium]